MKDKHSSINRRTVTGAAFPHKLSVQLSPLKRKVNVICIKLTILCNPRPLYRRAGSNALRYLRGYRKAVMYLWLKIFRRILSRLSWGYGIFLKKVESGGNKFGTCAVILVE